MGTMRAAKPVALLGFLSRTGISICGLALFSGWIVYREGSALRSTIWVVLMMVLGFWTASLYTWLAPQSSHGDWQRFWMGRWSRRSS